MKPNVLHLFCAPAVIVGSLLLAATSAMANTFTVTTTADFGAGSLRDAITQANAIGFGAQSIVFSNTTLNGAVNFHDGVARTLTLTSQLPTINLPTTVVGPGAERLTLERETGRILELGTGFFGSSTTVSLSGLTFVTGQNYGGSTLYVPPATTLTLEQCVLTSTDTVNGGSALLNEGSATINNSTFVGNSALDGGAIYNTGTLLVKNSSLAKNSAAGSGGALYNNNGTVDILKCTLSGNTSPSGGGGIHNHGAGSITVSHSTLSGNKGEFRGGGIYNTSGILLVRHCCFSGNLSNEGGGIYSGGTATVSHCSISGNKAEAGPAGGIASSGNLTLKNSVLAGNTATTVNPDLSGTVASNGANFVGDATGATGLTVTDKTFASTLTNLAQIMGPLASNGGPTLTFAPSLSGPLVDGGKTADLPLDTLDVDGDANTTEPTPQDQRGLVTPYGPQVDIGAVEYSASPYLAPSLVVTSVSDVGSSYDATNTLRDAMAYANTLTGAQTITFSKTTAFGAVNFYDGTPRTIDLTGQLPTLNRQTTLTGPGASKLTLRRPPTATADYRIMAVVTGGNVTVSGVTMTGGREGEGGAIYNSDANLVINDCVLSGNTATTLGGAIRTYAYANPSLVTLNRTVVSGNVASESGGGIMNSGSFADAAVILNDCTVSNNSVTSGNGRGGGIFGSDPVTVNTSTFTGNTAGQGGAISMFNGPLVINQCTLSGNSVAYTGENDPLYYRGGGIHSEYAAVTIKNSTITGNTCPNPGGGVSIGYSTTLLTLNNTIVAGNTGTTAPDIAGTITSNGANFIGNPAGASGGSFSDKTFANTSSTLATLLGPLANNGGPTMTHMLPAGSPAIDAGNNGSVGAPDVDQRGYGPRIKNSTVDIGAVEAGTFPRDDFTSLVVTGTGDALDPYDGQRTLREVMNLAGFFSSPIVSTITFSDGSVPGTTNFHDNLPETIDVGSELPALRQTTVLLGPGANKLTVRRPSTATALYRIMSVNAGATATISGLHITGGNTAGTTGSNSAGGGLYSQGTVTVTGCRFTGNRSQLGSGICNAGNLTINHSTFSGNGTTAPGSGGGSVAIFNGNTSQLVVNNCTISGNGGSLGGGIEFFGSGSVVVNNSTIVGNTASSAGGGIWTEQAVTLNNTIVAGNTSGGTGPDIYGPITSNGANFIGTTSGATGGSLSDKTFQNTGNTTLAQLLGPLADNGGPTQTHALAASSAAINAGNNTAANGLFTDQRGYGPRITGGTVDMGAYESATTSQENPSLVVTSTAAGSNPFDGQNSLGDAIDYAQRLTGPQMITFSATTANGSVNFHDGILDTITSPSYQISTGKEVSITGPGAKKLKIISGFYTYGITTLSGITVTSNTSFGGAIYNGFGASMSVNDCAFLGGNSTVFNFSSWMSMHRCLISGLTPSAPPLGNTDGTLIVNNSTISGNVSTTTVSGIRNLSGTLFVNHSTITGNSSPETGGIQNYQNAYTGKITIRNSIIAGNTSTNGTPDLMGPGITSNGANFIGDPAGSTAVTATDKTFASTSTTLAQLLAPLADNGGYTMTHALVASSPAINAGNSTAAADLTTDQRGPGYLRLFGTAVDIGAYEFGAGTVSSTLLTDWRTLHGLPANGSQDLANPSNDGVPNLLKYAFNLAPAAGDLARSNLTLLSPTGTAGLPLITRNASGQLVITFLRRKASTTPGVTYTPETGSLLTDFTALSLSGATLTSIDANWERVVVTDPSTATKRFGRVRVQAAP